MIFLTYSFCIHFVVNSILIVCAHREIKTRHKNMVREKGHHLKVVYVMQEGNQETTCHHFCTEPFVDRKVQ